MTNSNEILPILNEKNFENDPIVAQHVDFTENKAKIKSKDRLYFEAQVEVIKKQIGNLETVRKKLNLSQRKMSQLLLVDPSAWSRWVAEEQESAPPHIYRALQWYMSLQEQIPGLNAAYFLQKDTDVLKKEFKSLALAQTQDLEKSLSLKLEQEIVALKALVSETKTELALSQKNYHHFKKTINLLLVCFLFLALITIFVVWFKTK
jgi:transcriptional regulator with XRE-family HTH domain